MERRIFIEKSFLAWLGISVAPSLLASCSEDEIMPATNYEGKVLIIGAGVAGLYAGYTLWQKGIDFIIIEASETTGGRLSMTSDFADFPIDLGAQWLHGKKSKIGELVNETNTKIVKDNSEEVFWFNNQLRDSLPKSVEDILEPNGDLPDLSYKDFATKQGLGEEYQFIVEQAAGDLGADSSDISIKWTGIEEYDWDSGEDDYKFETTFFDLIDSYITSKIRDKIILNTPVRRIDYSTNQIQVIDNNQTVHLADKVIITVPITILQNSSIEFIPALPTAKVLAFKKIGMGAGLKVFLKFTEKFYAENIIGGQICAAYADESIGKVGKDNVLLAFAMGKQAESLTNLQSDLAITNAILAELDSMYGNKATATFIKSHVENWTTKPYIKGAYSYSKVGIGNARSIAAEPVAEKLFFAGEAMNLNGQHQSVQGAAETGYNAVARILK